MSENVATLVRQTWTCGWKNRQTVASQHVIELACGLRPLLCLFSLSMQEVEFSPSVISLSNVAQASVNVTILTDVESTETEGVTDATVESLLQKVSLL